MRSTLLTLACATAMSVAACEENGSTQAQPNSRPDKFSIQFDGWEFDRLSGRRMVASTSGQVTMNLSGSIHKGDESTSADILIQRMGENVGVVRLNLSKENITCKNSLSNDEHPIDLVVDSEDPVRGTISGELGCGKAPNETWVSFNGKFNEEGF